MTRQCAWCSLILSRIETAAEERVTHTICEPCAAEILSLAGLRGDEPALGSSQTAPERNQAA